MSTSRPIQVAWQPGDKGFQDSVAGAQDTPLCHQPEPGTAARYDHTRHSLASFVPYINSSGCLPTLRRSSSINNPMRTASVHPKTTHTQTVCRDNLLGKPSSRTRGQLATYQPTYSSGNPRPEHHSPSQTQPWDTMLLCTPRPALDKTS